MTNTETDLHQVQLQFHTHINKMEDLLNLKLGWVLPIVF